MEPGDGWLRPSSYQDAPSPITTKTTSLSGRNQPPPQMPPDNESNNSDPAPPSPGGETPNFRTNIGDFPHQLPPKAFQGQVLSLRARDPKGHHNGAHRLGG